MKPKWLNIIDLIFILIIAVFWIGWFSNGTLMSGIISASVGWLVGGKLVEVMFF